MTQKLAPHPTFEQIARGGRFILPEAAAAATPENQAFVYMKIGPQVGNALNAVNLTTGGTTAFLESEAVIPIA